MFLLNLHRKFWMRPYLNRSLKLGFITIYWISLKFDLCVHFPFRWMCASNCKYKKFDCLFCRCTLYSFVSLVTILFCWLFHLLNESCKNVGKWTLNDIYIRMKIANKTHTHIHSHTEWMKIGFIHLIYSKYLDHLKLAIFRLICG